MPAPEFCALGAAETSGLLVCPSAAVAESTRASAAVLMIAFMAVLLIVRRSQGRGSATCERLSVKDVPSEPGIAEAVAWQPGPNCCCDLVPGAEMSFGEELTCKEGLLA